MAGWHHRCNEHELGEGMVRDREAWCVEVHGGCKELDMTG